MISIEKSYQRWMAAGSVFIGLQMIIVPQVTAAAAIAPMRSQRFEDWSYRCADVKDRAEKHISHCEVTQVAQVRQDGKTTNVLTLAIAKVGRDGEGRQSRSELLLTAVVPLNVMLSEGLSFSVAGKETERFSYRNCNEAGCWVQQKLAPNILSQFKSSKDAQAHLRLMNGERVDITFSLKGLNKALAQLQKIEKA